MQVFQLFIAEATLSWRKVQTPYEQKTKYRLDNEAKGSTRFRNREAVAMEPKREARGFYDGFEGF